MSEKVEGLTVEELDKLKEYLGKDDSLDQAWAWPFENITWRKLISAARRGLELQEANRRGCMYGPEEMSQALAANAQLHQQLENANKQIAMARDHEKEIEWKLAQREEQLRKAQDRIKELEDKVGVWKSVSELPKGEYLFVLTYCDGAMRTLLWNPRGFWEHPNPIGQAVGDHELPTHFIELPDGPDAAITSENEKGAK